MRKALLALAFVMAASAAWAQPTVTTNPVKLGWDPNAITENVIGYKVTIDQTTTDVSNNTVMSTTLPLGDHDAFVTAYSADKVGPPSDVLHITVVAPTPTCPVVPSIAVSTWDRTIAVGNQGTVYFHFISSWPIVQVQARVNGSQTVGQMDGTDLRAAPGITFSMPRTPGSYNLTVYAKDSNGCSAETTTQRTVVVQ